MNSEFGNELGDNNAIAVNAYTAQQKRIDNLISGIDKNLKLSMSMLIELEESINEANK